MTQEESRKTLDLVAYLCRCAADSIIPDRNRLEDADWDAVFDFANRHMVAAAVGMALESAGIRNERFRQEIGSAQRKNALLDADRAKVLAALEEAGIWYMPLKGSVLKNLYPRYGMRQMSDNDILFDASRRADVRKIMKGLGFTTKEYDRDVHDVYHKEPVSNFEMHVHLINEDVSNSLLHDYYTNVKERLIRDEGNGCGYHFSDEDFYLYIVAHEYKHYSHKGTGIRSLLDTYVYLKKKQAEMDSEYICREAEKMNLSDFEEKNRQLAFHLFGGDPLTDDEEEMLKYICDSGTYGKHRHNIDRQIQQKGRMGFFLSRLTLPLDEMKRYYPALRKAPWLYPVFWIWRLVSRFFTRHRKFMFQLKSALGLRRDQK